MRTVKAVFAVASTDMRHAPRYCVVNLNAELLREVAKVQDALGKSLISVTCELKETLCWDREQDLALHTHCIVVNRGSFYFQVFDHYHIAPFRTVDLDLVDLEAQLQSGDETIRV